MASGQAQVRAQGRREGPRRLEGLDDGLVAPAAIRLHDGTQVAVRPIVATDKDLLRDAFERLSDESRYRRFFSPLPRLSPAQLRYLTEIDHRDHEALVALDPATGQGIGVVRYIRAADDPQVAEIAVTVVDDWQGRGLGSALQEALADRARSEGITTFSALVQAENERSLHMLEGLGDAVLSSDGDTVELRIALPERGSGAGLQDLLRHAAARSVVVVGGAMHWAASTGRARRRPPPAASTAITSIAVGTDGSLTAQQAARVGFELAHALDARVHIVSAYNAGMPAAMRRLRAWVPDTVSPLSWVVAGREDAELLLAAASDVAAAAFDLDAQLHAVPGDPADALMTVADEHDVDVIVVGTRGAVADKLARHAPCHVLIVPTG